MDFFHRSKVRLDESAAWHTFRRIALVALVLLLFSRTGWNELTFLASELPVLQLFPDFDAQSRLQQGEALYDTLRAADVILPPDAAVLLVTAGTEARHQEYVAFHRALYTLTPRLVWWANPAVPSGTWESRWWMETPLSAERLNALADAHNADFILFWQVRVPEGFASGIPLGDDARLVERSGAVSWQVQSADTSNINFAGLVISLLVVLAIGLLIVAGVARLGYHATALEAMALAWALGAGCISLFMFWLNSAGLTLDALRGLILVVVLIALGGLILGKRKVLRDIVSNALAAISRSGIRPLEIFLLLWIALQVGYTAVLAVGRPLVAWDSWVTYALKARTMYLANQISPAVYSDVSRSVTHLDYPLLVPLVETWTFRWAGSADDRLAGISAVLFFAAVLTLVYVGLRCAGVGRPCALTVVAVTASLPFLNGAAAAVMADLPLAVYALIAGIYLLRWRETGARGALVVAALAAGLMPWTKREGVVLLAAFVVLLVASGWRERRAWVAAGACLVSALVLAGPWWLLMAREGVASVDIGPVTLQALQANVGRLPVIRYYEGLRLLAPEWLLAWLMVLVLVLSGRAKLAGRMVLPGTALLYLAAMSFAYVFSDFVPYQQHVVSSIDRLAVHVAPLIMVWGALYASSFLVAGTESKNAA
jgi:hypothetical protein